MNTILSYIFGDYEDDDTVPSEVKVGRESVITILKSLCRVENAGIPHNGEVMYGIEGVVIRKEKSNAPYKNGLIGRVYLDRNAGDSSYFVGWVLNDAFTDCMLCEEEFEIFNRSRHHCRACGNLICDECSLNRAIIQQLSGEKSEVKGSRVCDQCYAKYPPKNEAWNINVT